MVDKKHKISALVFGKLSCFEEIRVGDYLFTDKNKLFAYRVIQKKPKSSEVTVRASMFRDDGFKRNTIYTREDVKPASEGCQSEKSKHKPLIGWYSAEFITPVLRLFKKVFI